MTSQGLRLDLHLADARGVGAATPGFEVLLGGGLRALVPELPQVLFEVVRDRQLLVELERFMQLSLLVDLRVLLQVLRVHHQQVASALQHFAVHLVGEFVVHLASEVAEFLIHELHHMEPIKHQRRLRQVLHHSCDGPAGHVGGHSCDLRPSWLQPGKKRLQSRLAAPLEHRHDGLCVEVQHHRPEPVPRSEMVLIDRQSLQPRELRPRQFLQPREIDLTHRVPRNAEGLDDVLNRQPR